ncbi:hypothetical protein ANANG_G00053280 [Anguilla anguilla]|uniref:C-type lectin domain-containing protein n=1 Tax=Anguilla anguilla TaxID=7936 RepID=A0A9D3S4B6_ANGAN|nr:hypothetical protein ANANG_G00053280 [Anguilla anguilla]
MGYAPPPAGILRAQCCTYYICLSVSVADQLRDNFSPVLYLLPSTLHRMLRSTLLILAVAGLHAMPLPPREDTFSPLQVGAPVPEEFRRQGTQPSRPYLVDLRTGLLQDQPCGRNVDQFRQGTQNSRAVLVDVRSGLPIQSVGEMQRTMGKVYVPPSLDEFRQGTQNSRAILVDPRTGLIRDPIGEMSRNSVWTVSRTEPVCQGSVINARCYSFFSDAKTFNDAEASCRQLAPGGHLASVTSPDLHSRLAAMVTEASNGPVLTWLGGVLQADKFRWIDGSSWGYSDLMPGRLQPGSDSERCLEMFRVDERWWSTADCSLQRPFICSHPLPA